MNHSWLSALDLDPESSWLRMGTRRLSDRPWLVPDAKAPFELALRAELLESRSDEVLAEPPSAAAPAEELERMVSSTGTTLVQGPSPLRRLGASVQEDFCLLERTDAGWILRAAVLCFPSRWRLRDKLDRPLGGVHGPVEGYAESLDTGVTALIDRLGDRIVLRRNWFIHPNGSLFQPDRPPNGDPLVPVEECGEQLFVRSERQTLRLLPDTNWCVFTIRIQYCTLTELVSQRGNELRRWLGEASPTVLGHRGISPEQAAVLGAWASCQ